MAAFTIFAFGTGENTSITFNVISQFAERCQNEQLVINGPDLLGRRVVQNAAKTTESILNWLEEQPSIDNNLNLVGFSRGAITQLYIANYLQKKEHELKDKQSLTDKETLLLEKLTHLKIHLIAIDPVAGMGDKRKYYGRKIPKNVKSFVAFYQMDERRIDFKPQDITRLIIESPEETQVSLLPLYGNHAEAIRIRTSQRRSAPILVWHSLYHFLTQHGTEFIEGQIPNVLNIENNLTQEEIKVLSQTEWLELFSLHKQERPQYHGAGNIFSLFDGIPTSRRIRTLNAHRAFYVKNHGFFINQLERGLFKITYPRVFNYLFENNMKDNRFPSDSQCTKEQVIEELKQLYNNNPLLFARLQARNVKVNEVGEIHIGESSGYYDFEDCASVKQITPHLLPSTPNFAEESAKLKVLHDLEMEVYRLTFRYEREKREIQFVGERSQAERAKVIRSEVLKIINQGTDDRDEKYKQVIAVLERHYFRLLRAYSSSELRPMLKQLLKKYHHEYDYSQTTLSQDVLTHFVDVTMSTAIALMNFIGHLAYIGPIVLYPLGYFIENFCRRIHELLDDYTENPLVDVFLGFIKLIEEVGYLIKNNFGLLPLFDFLSVSIKDQRDEWLIQIRDIQISRKESQGSDEADQAEELNNSSAALMT